MSTIEAAHIATIVVPALWIGCVLAISFVETPLKFRAPGVTREAALSIGRLVFRALARVERGLWAVELLALLLAGWSRWTGVWFMLLTVVLIAQQAWLLPRLDARAAAVVAGEKVSAGRALHGVFVAAEVAKIVLLALLVVSLASGPRIAGVDVR